MTISKKMSDFLEQGSWIRRMFEDGIELKKKYGPENVFDLSLGNPIFSPPDVLYDEMKSLILNPDKSAHRYMPNAGLDETREKVAEFLTATTNHNFGLNNILMTGGAGGALNVALKSILDPGDEVIFFTPFFPEYFFYTDNHSGVSKIIESDDNFIPDLKSFDANINSKTKAVIINSPNNPSGIVYNDDFYKEFSEILKKHETLLNREIFVISDEPYRRIIFDDLDCPNILDFHDNTIVASSFSKDLAIPGERVGYLGISPNIKNTEILMDGLVFANRVLGFVNAPAFMQRAIANILFNTVNIEEYLLRRNFLCDELSKLGYNFIIPKGAFYLFPKSPLDDDILFTKLLKENKVLVVPGSGFGKKGYFRISFCVDWESIKGSISGFEKAINSVS
ncbi:MAG: pyridoxal phosphate-dependent aminotransferase [Dehalococcoidia bacterium]